MIISDGINHGKLQSIIIGELKKAGLKHRLKKIILKNVKDHKTVFGAPLVKVPSCSVICCGSTLSIPVVITEMCTVLRINAQMEGLFRKAGSQARQKDIKRLLDAGGCVSEGHHPIDVASVLKLYLRCLPEPLISAEVQDLLLRCRVASGDQLKPILHTLLLLPVLHVHLLHYVMELLNFIASRHKENLMDSSNLAIVMAPSIMPLPASSSAQRLEHHVALVKIFIENSKHIGMLSDELMSQLDDDSGLYLTRRKKRRSGSINRVLNGLRKMVSGSVHTPATVREHTHTPVLSKSAAKRKHDAYEGLSAKTKESIKKCLPQKELTFTPMKVGLERKRLRLSLVDARSSPQINIDFGSKNSETSISSEDLLTSSEHLFSAHDTIDLSPDNKGFDKDYVRISKREYEEIKNRVSAIETRLSREFTDAPPPVEPFQQVQDKYQQTLDEVAMLNCPTSDHLARRLSKELKIRPKEEAKIMRSPSARKIGSIRRRSKENIVKLVRHKSWNASSQSYHNVDRFYPYMRPNRERTSTVSSDVPKKSPRGNWDGYSSDSPAHDVSDPKLKYQLRKRVSLNSDCNLNKTIGKPHSRRSLNVNISSYDTTMSESSNATLDSSSKSNSAHQVNEYQNVAVRSNFKNKMECNRRSPTQHKWRSAAAFFMNKTGEVDSGCQSGRPSVNKLRKQNAGAVLAKAKMFETSSDRSSERIDEKVLRTGFARKPRISGAYSSKSNNPPCIPPKNFRNVPPVAPLRSNKINIEVNTDWRQNRKTTPPIKKAKSPMSNVPRTPMAPPSMKKPLLTPRTCRTPMSTNEPKRLNTPMKAMQVSPRRKSPRQKIRQQVFC